MVPSAGGDGYKEATQVPKYGLKVKLNHVYPEKITQGYVPTIKQLWQIFPLILRYIIYYIRSRLTGKSIVMDYVEVVQSKRIYGVPLGGIGAGTIGRGYKGEFCRFQLKPGLYEYNTIDANQFIVTIKDSHQETIFHSLLSTFPRKKLKSWTSSIDGSKCSYSGLYPRSWTEYDLSQYGITLICRQVSPVIPNNYKDSSLPCSVFVWEVKNVSNENLSVTIAFTFKNGTGDKNQDRSSACNTKAFNNEWAEGVILHQTINKMPCAYALSVKSSPDSNISKCLYFDPNSDGIKPWIQLKNNGAFDKPRDKSHGNVFGEMGCGVAAQLKIMPNSTDVIEMSLVWDMPTVSFPKGGRKYNKYYTKYFGSENAVLKIVDYAFRNYRNWETAIYEWQTKTFDTSKLQIPDWYRAALFNESYFVSDGGTFWCTLDDEEIKNLPVSDPRREFGRFFYLEGHEYRMCNTYDVHFYGSFCLIMNWPKLQLSLQYDMRDAIFVEIPDKVKMLYDGHYVERKKPNSVPHDVGDPGEEPFLLPNSYPIHDVSEWRDLNTKFVLQVFRDAVLINSPVTSIQYIKDMYNACYTVMHKCEDFDVDNDGLIENGGTPDQTFDTWIMCGASAYCGGLWLAALHVMTIMADVVHKPDDKSKFADLLKRGKEAFEAKLWNGKYYNFDCSENESKSIMADQLCGQWYLRCCGFGYEVFDVDKVQTALRTIFRNNVMSFCDGQMGAVNGFIDGAADRFTIQSEEVWTGVTYALAASFIQEDLVEEAWVTAGGMYNSLSEIFGLAFETPEALYAQKHYRSSGYMRPLSIWSIQLAVEIASGLRPKSFIINSK